MTKLIFTKGYILNVNNISALEMTDNILIMTCAGKEYTYILDTSKTSMGDIIKKIVELMFAMEGTSLKERHLEEYEGTTPDVNPEEPKRRGRPPKNVQL